MTVARPLALALLLLSAVAAAAPPADEVAIREVLRRQAEAWSRHDLEAYMEGYWRSPELTFYGGGTVTRGWQETLARYRQKYQAPGAEMGRLEMNDIDVTLVGGRAAIVRGRWQLQMAARTPRGLFTLLMRKLPGTGWRIVHDHSSSE